MKKRRDFPVEDERGIAIVLSLLILGLVTAMIMAMATQSSRDGSLSLVSENKGKSFFIAEGGIKAAVIALKEDGGMNGYDTLDEIWSRPAPPITLGEGDVTVLVVDEERKININTLIMPNGISDNTKMVAIFNALLEKLSIDTAITEGILDWLDGDDTPRPEGAESDSYRALSPPYRSKNDLFDSPYELKLVKGVDEKTFLKLLPYVTTTGSGRININTAPEAILASLARGESPEYQDLLTDQGVEDIIRYRKDTPFEKAEDITNVSASMEELYRKSRIRDIITSKSTAFTIHATAHVEKGTTKMISGLSRKGQTITEIYRVAN